MPSQSPHLKNWKEEKQAVYLYRAMAAREADENRRGLFLSLARAADEQAAIWARGLEGAAAPAFSPNWRARLVARLIAWLGPQKIKPVLASMKVRGLSVYSGRVPGASSIDQHPMPTEVGEIGKRHHASGEAGNLRAAVFGVNDGLVSNASLILGMAGAGSEPATVLIAGAAGALAGAFSMAAGEYVSVKSQKEMFEYQIGLEREELSRYPEEEAAELSLIYRARGLSPADADRLARQMIQNPEQGLDALAREELGLNPRELASPWGAAFSSFASFLVGALIPLLPFIINRGNPYLKGTLALSGLSLFGVGAALSLFTGRNALLSGLRMLLIGGGAGALTYFVGNAIQAWFF